MDLDFLKDSDFMLFHFIAHDSRPGFNPDVFFNSDLYSALIQCGHLSHFIRDEDITETLRSIY